MNVKLDIAQPPIIPGFFGRPGELAMLIRRCVIGGLVFGLLAYVSIQLTLEDGRIAALWLPNALAVAFLLRNRFSGEWLFLLSLLAGNVAANLAVGDLAARALTLSSANCLEITLAVFLARKFCGERPDMRDVDTIFRFILVAGMIAPVVAATFATIVSAFYSAFDPLLFVKFALADALGMMIIAPSALIFYDAALNPRWPSRREVREWVWLTLLATCVTVFVFTQTQYPLLFLVPPMVILHAFRLGSLGTAFSTLQVAAIATLCTFAGRGPINLLDYPLNIEVIILESFLASAFLLGLPVAAILHKRDTALASLAERESELALLALNVSDAILQYDRKGVCTFASSSVEDVLGAPCENFIGSSMADRAHSDAQAAIEDACAALMSGDEERRRFTYRRKIDDQTGKPVFIEADCTVYRDEADRHPDGIVVSARDVTERVELERQLVRARRHAENAARAKAQFLANMSHEIRTPMNGVLGFVELLLKSELSPSQRRHAQLVSQSGRSMMLLLNDILDISKIEAGQLVISTEPVDLRQLLHDCIHLHSPRAEQKGVTLGLRFGDDLPPAVVTDGLRVRQIVLNLIGNAVKFTEEGKVEVRAHVREDEIAIAVSDTGIGIDDDRMDTIFSPFEQEEGSTTRKYGGTGLGLTISRQLARLLNGSLSVISRKGEGSIFTLRLPRIVADQAPNPNSHRSRDLTEEFSLDARILLAEDHDVNRLLVCDMLDRCGLQIDVAEDGRQAIERVMDAYKSGVPFDLVLMDVQMPGCDGYAATRAIREAGIDAQSLPVVALTANAFPEDIQAALDAGMQAHLSKPLVFEEVVSALNRWLPSRIVDEQLAASAQAPHPPSVEEPLPVEVGRAAAVGTEWTRHSPALIERWQERRSEALGAISACLPLESAPSEHLDGLARQMHKLAGTAAMFGEDSLGERAAELERAIRASRPADECEELAKKLLRAA